MGNNYNYNYTYPRLPVTREIYDMPSWSLIGLERELDIRFGSLQGAEQFNEERQLWFRRYGWSVVKYPPFDCPSTIWFEFEHPTVAPSEVVKTKLRLLCT